MVFLDIQMPRVSGLEMLAMLDPEKTPRIVFVTAFDDYAVQALSLIHISEPTRHMHVSRMPSSA
nr:response regulator [Chromobacterium sp. ASV5]